jgi:hypothetical protein
MEFEQFISGNKIQNIHLALQYKRSKRFHHVKLLVAGVRPWASH